MSKSAGPPGRAAQLRGGQTAGGYFGRIAVGHGQTHEDSEFIENFASEKKHWNGCGGFVG